MSPHVDADEGQTLYLVLPEDLSTVLMEDGLAVPFLRDDRADVSLLPAVVVAVSVAVTTVVSTKLTAKAVDAIAERIKSWLGREERLKGTVTITVRSTRPGAVAEIAAVTEMDQDEIRALLAAAIGDREPGNAVEPSNDQE